MLKKLSLTILLLITFIFNTGFVVVGHRGDPIKAPEETFQSIDTAFSDGAQWVELDIHKSSDDQLIISHDRNLKRITGQDMIVSQYPASQLTQLKQSNGQNIYTIDQLFERYQKQPNVKFLIETKKTKRGNPQDMETILVDSIKKYNMEDRVMVHSFSLDSLENMQKLAPNIPRIFIAGSLKRLNFEAFQYSNAVNVSSALLTPQLIDQLHALGQQVYVWDAMNENPKKWNWLINLPIDGVVTNFPATAAHYQQLKNHANQSQLNFDATLLAEHPQTVWENPYPQAPVKGTIAPQSSLHIQSMVTTNGQTFLQIDTNRFIMPAGVVQSDLVDNLAPFLQRTIIAKQSFNLQATPENKNAFKGSIQPYKTYHITALQNIDGNSWAQINNQGWIKIEHILVKNTDFDTPTAIINDSGSLKRTVNIRQQTALDPAIMLFPDANVNAIPQITYTLDVIPNNLPAIKNYIQL